MQLEYNYLCMVKHVYIHIKGTVLSQPEQTFKQGMESVSEFKMNTVTEIYWLIYAQRQ